MIALVLGSGAAKGLAHIGVLKVLEQEGIKPDLIVGCSIGAVVGGLYASGLNADEMYELAVNLKRSRFIFMIDPSNPVQAFLNGEKIRRWLDEVLPVKEFSQLKIPFACVATDLNTGELAILNSGNVLDSIMASISVPIIFPPVEINGHYYVDGGVKSPLPVKVARNLGADRVIAVNLLKLENNPETLYTTKKPPSYLVAMRAVDIMQVELSRSDMETADVVISPDVTEFSFYEFYKARKIIPRGEEAARMSLEKIKSFIRQ